MPSTDPLVRSHICNRLSAVNLPTVPKVLIKLLELCQKDDTVLTDLTDLISRDVALTARVLGCASSALYQGGNQASLMQCVQILGMDMIKLICISESVYQVFGDFKHINDAAFQAFWEHSVLTAISARLVAKGMHYAGVEEAYLAGLLHDVGRLALLSVEPSVSESSVMDDEALCRLEHQLFKFTHAEAGAWIADQWHFDSPLADSILFHHEAIERLENTHLLIRIVPLAELLAKHIKENFPIPLDLIAILSGSGALRQEDAVRNIVKQIKETFAALGMANDDIVKPEQKASGSVDNRAAIPQGQADKARLNNKLRNYILTSETGELLVKREGKSDSYQTILQLTCLLFDFDAAILFAADQSEQVLKGIPAGNDRKYVADFVIPLDGPATVVSEAWFHRRPTFISHEHDQLEVIEAQLQRVLESQCLVCIPFCNTDTKIGVLVGSIGVDRLLGLRKRSSLLYEYAAQATRTLHTLEKKREVSSRFEALSVAEARQHARQIAHEVNNPLAIIKNYLSVLKNKVVQREFIGDELLILEEEIDRISELVARLARPQSESLDQVTEINQTVNAVMKLFRDSGFVPPSVEILTHTSARLDMVKCPHYILKQILMNLLKNSVEAMPAGGKIEISCKDFINLDGKKYIGLCILDTGPGIRDEIMHTMFIAIKSTKDMKHRGMGLSIVYDLVSQVQGHISCRSNDKGTLFEVLFPLHVPESEVAKNSTQ